MKYPSKRYECVVEFSDGTPTETFRGYLVSCQTTGMLSLAWLGEVVMIPWHRIKMVHERSIEGDAP
jgi:hypothetical protein